MQGLIQVCLKGLLWQSGYHSYKSYLVEIESTTQNMDLRTCIKSSRKDNGSNLSSFCGTFLNFISVYALCMGLTGIANLIPRMV